MKKIFLVIMIVISSFITFAEGSSTADIIGIVNPGKVYLADHIDKEAKRMGIPVDVMLGIWERESGFNNLPKNKSNAAGIGQMLPSAFKQGLITSGMSEQQYNQLLRKYGNVDRMRADEKLNITASIGLMKHLTEKRGVGDAIMSYNMGAGNFNKLINNESISSATREEGTHYAYDVDRKLKVMRKVRKNGINSLTDEERRILKNAVPRGTEYKSQWNNARKNLNTIKTSRGSGGFSEYNPDGATPLTLDDTSVSKTAVAIKPTNAFDFDEYADKILEYVSVGTKKIGNVAITIASLLFLIQLILDSIKMIGVKELKTIIFKLLIGKGLVFSVYLILIKKITDGAIIKELVKFTYGLVSLMTGTNAIKINDVWLLKESINAKIWEDISNIWGWSSLMPWELQKDMTLSIILIILIALISLAFFGIMIDLFQYIVGLYLVGSFTTLLLPLGLFDGTKDLYNSGKILSIAVNFVVKMVAIMFAANIGIKVLLDTNVIEKITTVNMEQILTGEAVTFLLIIWTVKHLITKIDISF